MSPSRTGSASSRWICFQHAGIDGVEPPLLLGDVDLRSATKDQELDGGTRLSLPEPVIQRQLSSSDEGGRFVRWMSRSHGSSTTWTLHELDTMASRTASSSSTARGSIFENSSVGEPTTVRGCFSCQAQPPSPAPTPSASTEAPSRGHWKTPIRRPCQPVGNRQHHAGGEKQFGGVGDRTFERCSERQEGQVSGATTGRRRLPARGGRSRSRSACSGPASTAPGA